MPLNAHEMRYNSELRIQFSENTIIVIETRSFRAFEAVRASAVTLTNSFTVVTGRVVRVRFTTKRSFASTIAGAVAAFDSIRFNFRGFQRERVILVRQWGEGQFLGS